MLRIKAFMADRRRMQTNIRGKQNHSLITKTSLLSLFFVVWPCPETSIKDEVLTISRCTVSAPEAHWWQEEHSGWLELERAHEFLWQNLSVLCFSSEGRSKVCSYSKATIAVSSGYKELMVKEGAGLMWKEERGEEEKLWDLHKEYKVGGSTCA